MTSAGTTSAPKAMKNAPTASATSTIWSACVTNRTRPTLIRWRRCSGGPAATSRSTRSTSRGRRTTRKADPTTTSSAAVAANVAPFIPANTCHISVLMNRTTLNSSSSGIARASRSTAAASCSPTRRPVKRRIDATP